MCAGAAVFDKSLHFATPPDRPGLCVAVCVHHDNDDRDSDGTSVVLPGKAPRIIHSLIAAGMVI